MQSAVGEGRPTASVIVEWENARSVGTARPTRVIGELLSQISEASPVREIELIFVCGSGEEAGDIRAVLAAANGVLPDRLKIVESATGNYYQQKNFGAAHADGELLLFLDSDVLPQPGWLHHLLAAASDGDVDIAGGVTIVPCAGFYSCAMALIWIFPLPREETGIVPARYFHANNFAIPADLFAAHPFPDTGQHRGQCGFLAEELRAAGHRIWLSGSARVEHPPPAGVGRFFLRAWRGGRDLATGQRLQGKGWLARGMKLAAADLLGAFRRVRSDRALVGFGYGRAFAAAALAVVYYGTSYLGFLSSIFAKQMTPPARPFRAVPPLHMQGRNLVSARRRGRSRHRQAP